MILNRPMLWTEMSADDGEVWTVEPLQVVRVHRCYPWPSPSYANRPRQTPRKEDLRRKIQTGAANGPA